MLRNCKENETRAKIQWCLVGLINHLFSFLSHLVNKYVAELYLYPLDDIDKYLVLESDIAIVEDYLDPFRDDVDKYLVLKSDIAEVYLDPFRGEINLFKA